MMRQQVLPQVSNASVGVSTCCSSSRSCSRSRPLHHGLEIENGLPILAAIEITPIFFDSLSVCARSESRTSRRGPEPARKDDQRLQYANQNLRMKK